MPIYEEKEKINGQKRWYIRTYITDGNGKRKQITKHNKDWIGRDGYWEAQQEENKLKKKKIIQNSNITLNNLIKSYLEEIKSNAKLGTYVKHESNINKYILPYFENVKINNITNKDILEWKQKLDSKNYSLNFKKSIFITFGALLSHGCKYYDLENNPVKNVGNFKAKKGTTKKEIKIMTEAQFNEFICFIKNNYYKQVFTTLFYTGMRRGELLALEWEDIDFTKNTININKTLNPKLIDENDDSPKTNKANRTINLIPQAINSLKQIEKKSKKPFEEVTLTTLKRYCDKGCLKIGIKNFRIHDFRHSFASMCIDKGVPIEVISEYLGHENITTTLNTYSHLYPHSQDKLTSKFK